MKHIRIAVAVVALGFFGGAACSMIAQEKDSASPKYDVAQEKTVEGTIVQAVNDYKCPVSGTIGSHITIKTSSGSTLEIHLAPTAFLKDDDMVLQMGDNVKIVGVKFVYEDRPAMLAKTLTVGQATFYFRDEKGRPLWERRSNSN
jgi:hypothetical protein